MRTFDILIVGGGPAGLVAACLAANEGARTALVSPQAAGEDPRTVAIMAPALTHLAAIGVWPGGLAQFCAPLKKLRIVDDTGSLISAPEVNFAAEEAGLDAFGWNVPLAALVPAIHACAEQLGVTFITAECSGMSIDGSHAVITAGDMAISARLVIAADGRDSLLREAAGIPETKWNYNQCAIATSFSHSRPHRGVSTEYHRAGGPFTTVPLPGNRSSLVWMERPQRADALMALPADEFAAEIQASMHGELGRVTEVGPRRLFPMRGLMAGRLTAPRLLLLGEAAHTQPPIGAQGLNMSIADAATAATMAGDALKQGGDPGSAGLLQAYEAQRKPDIALRQSIVDAMNRSLLANLVPFDAARAIGLAALASIGPLRRHAMRRGLGPAAT